MSKRLKGVSICMLGGDLRELELAKKLLDYETDLRLVGFAEHPDLEKAKFFSDPLSAARGAEVVLGPMSNTDLQGRIHVRLDDKEPIDLTEVMESLPPKTPVFVGVAKPIIKQLADQYRLHLVETAEIDEIAIYNSIPTAEGALQLAMEKTPITIHGSRSLVVGFGRCGVTLARVLLGLGSKVSVAARRGSDRARADEMGCEALAMDELFSVNDFNLIFNTVPALVLTRPYLKSLRRDTLIIDIAAAPGGTDFDAAKELGIKAISALSLPGKVAPVTAGRILTDCIPRLLTQILGGDVSASDG